MYLMDILIHISMLNYHQKLMDFYYINLSIAKLNSKHMYFEDTA